MALLNYDLFISSGYQPPFSSHAKSFFSEEFAFFILFYVIKLIFDFVLLKILKIKIVNSLRLDTFQKECILFFCVLENWSTELSGEWKCTENNLANKVNGAKRLWLKALLIIALWQLIANNLKLITPAPPRAPATPPATAPLLIRQVCRLGKLSSDMSSTNLCVCLIICVYMWAV